MLKFDDDRNEVQLTLSESQAHSVMRALWLAADSDGISRTTDEEDFWSDLGDGIEDLLSAAGLLTAKEIAENISHMIEG